MSVEKFSVEKFTVTELAALRNDLIQGGIDSREAAELLQVFLMGRVHARPLFKA